jgi:outer membrane lipoprotein-sorting protein
MTTEPDLGPPDLVTLFYRANWTRLTLSASVHGIVDYALLADLVVAGRPVLHGGMRIEATYPPAEWGVQEFRATLRVAPVGRFRVDVLGVHSPDGAPIANDRSVRAMRTLFYSRDWTKSWQSAYPELLCPSQLLNGLSLEVAGRVTVAGRPALRVVGSPRPGAWLNTEANRLERIEVIADAATGILLRREEFYAGRTVSMVELTDVTFGAVTDDLEIPPPPGPGPDGTLPWPRSRWLAAEGASRVHATVSVTAGRYAAYRRARDTTAADLGLAAADDDPEAAMPPAEYWQAVGTAEPAGIPMGDQLVHILYGSGTAAFTATVHKWLDFTAIVEFARSGASEPNAVIQRLARTAAGLEGTAHLVTRVGIGRAGRYRADFLRAAYRGAKPVACDGSWYWHETPTLVMVRPAVPLARESSAGREIIELIDTTALLQRDFHVVTETEVNGRRAVVLRPRDRIDEGYEGVIIDAELGIMLRRVWYLGGRQVMRVDLRDVTPLAPADEDRLFAFTVPEGAKVVHVAPREGGRAR